MDINLQNGFILGAALQGKTEDSNPYSINVTFMNGENEYAKTGIGGEGKIAEPTEPPIPSGYIKFSGWFDGNDKITFPYKPSADKTLSARFSVAAHPELEYSGAGTLLFTDSSNQTAYHKKNDGTVIIAQSFYTSTHDYYAHIISINPLNDDNVKVAENAPTGSQWNFKYNDVDYYIYTIRASRTWASFTFTGNVYDAGDISTLSRAKLAEILDYYYLDE